MKIQIKINLLIYFCFDKNFSYIYIVKHLEI